MKSSKSDALELLMLDKSDQLKTHQWVYQLLRSNLLCGRIEPGIPLTIRGLAEILDVSPMPVTIRVPSTIRFGVHTMTFEEVDASQITPVSTLVLDPNVFGAATLVRGVEAGDRIDLASPTAGPPSA